MRGNKLLKFFDYWVGIPLVFLLSFFLRGKRKSNLALAQPKRILVVKLVALGDAVLLIPSLRALRKKYPSAEIVFLGTAVTEPVITQFPEYINSFISLEVKQLFSLKYSLGFIRRLREYHFDVVLDFEQWTRLTPLLISLAGIPVRLGFKTKEQYHHYLYTHAIERNPQQHEVDTFLSLSSLLTGESGDRSLELKVNEESARSARWWLQERGWKKEMPLVVLHPACGSHGFRREWPPGNYRKLIEKIRTTHNAFFLITGMPNEAAVMNAVSAQMGSDKQNYIFQRSDELIAMLSLASLVVSGNTGAMHLAAALHAPQVALHGPTNARIWGPVNPNAKVIATTCPACPCLDLGFEYHREDGYCMEQISFDAVAQASLDLLEKQ